MTFDDENNSVDDNDHDATRKSSILLSQNSQAHRNALTKKSHESGTSPSKES